MPSFIIKRLPVRFTYDNNYFNDLYQGIPIGGYNVLTERLFEKADVQTGVDFLEDKEKYLAMGETVIYTGAIDAFYNYHYHQQDPQAQNQLLFSFPPHFLALPLRDQTFYIYAQKPRIF